MILPDAFLTLLMELDMSLNWLRITVFGCADKKGCNYKSCPTGIFIPLGLMMDTNV